MLEKGKISSRQFIILVFLFTIGSSILIMPGGIAAAAKQNGWIASLAGMAAGLLLVILLNALGKMNPGIAFTQFCEQIAGKWLGKLICLCLFFYIFILGALVLRNLGDFVTTAIMPETPITFIHLTFLAVTAFAVRLGLEVIGRAAEILIPWVLLLVSLVILLILPEMEFHKMEPLFEGGLRTILSGTILVIGSPFLELVVFLLILPYLNQTKQSGKAFLAGVFLGGLLLVIVTLLCILVLGSDLTASQTYPTFTLAKKISIGDILERMEVLLAGGWFLTMFFKLTICFYASVLVLAQILELTDYRPLIYPLVMIMIVLSIVAYPNIAYFLTFVAEIWPYFAATFGLLLPLLLLVAAKLRGIGQG